MELRHSSTGHRLGKPWVTLVLDAYLRHVLAAYLTLVKTCTLLSQFSLWKKIRRKKT